MPGYRKVPEFVRVQIASCSTDTFYISGVRTFSTSELDAGALAHLGVTWDNGSVIPTSAIPPEENGRWSRYNVDGRLVIRRDLPKVWKTVGFWETPNFGDWSKGSHSGSFDREVFRREIWYAQRLPILIDVLARAGDQVTIGFRVDRVFDRTNLNERDLKLAASLLRENLNRHAAVTSTALSAAEWLADQRVTWEILPRGEATFERVLARLKTTPSSPRIREAQGRFEAVGRMHPGPVIVGNGEFSRYFGFKFRDDLVVLENLEYGNAIYVMFEDWSVLSQRTRIDLLADANADYTRIIHSTGWEDRLRSLLRARGHDVTGGSTTTT
jgi:hypothetical protein